MKHMKKWLALLMAALLALSMGALAEDGEPGANDGPAEYESAPTVDDEPGANDGAGEYESAPTVDDKLGAGDNPGEYESAPTEDGEPGVNDNAGEYESVPTVDDEPGANDDAGIGGGNDKNGGTVTISGGTVTAIGSNGGAGIGGGGAGIISGKARAGGTVTISGGTVTATGSNGGAGIGGGNKGDDGTVTISGGMVTADSYTGTVTLQRDFCDQSGSKVFPAGEPELGDIAGVTLVPRLAVKIERAIPNGKVSSDSDYATPGATVTLTAMPKDGYELGILSATDSAGNDIPVNADGTFTMPADDVTVMAWFKKITAITTKPRVDESAVLLATLTAVGDDALHLSITPVNGAEGYDVFAASCDSDDFALVASLPADATGFDMTGLLRKRGYKVIVRAYNLDGDAKVYANESPVAHCYTSGGSGGIVNPASVTAKDERTVRLGKTVNLRAKVKGVKRCTVLAHDGMLRYISSDPAVASVSSRGRVKAEGPGSCTVYALASNGAWKAVTIHVDAQPAKVKLANGEKRVGVGATLDLGGRVRLYPARAQTALTWSSSDPEVAAVDEYGVVTGLKPGKATIRVTTANGKKAKVKITVK